MKRHAVAIALALLVTACGSGDELEGGSNNGVPRNPVEVGKNISGCSWPSDAAGETDINGARYVTCNLGSQTVDIRTYVGDSYKEYYEYDPMALRSDDGKWVILGEDFVVTIYFPGEIDPEKVAEQVGGELVPKN